MVANTLPPELQAQDPPLLRKQLTRTQWLVKPHVRQNASFLPQLTVKMLSQNITSKERIGIRTPKRACSIYKAILS